MGWDSPDPGQGPESPWGFRGPKPPISPRPGKGSFLSKNPLFQGNTGKMGIFWQKTPFFRSCEGEGKWGSLDPETLFSRKWGFGALSGVGGIPSYGLSGQNARFNTRVSVFDTRAFAHLRHNCRRIVDRAQIAQSGLKLPFESHQLDFPEKKLYRLRSQNYRLKTHEGCLENKIQSPKRGRKIGAVRKLSKIYLTLLDDFWCFLPCAKNVEKCRRRFWLFLTLFDDFWPFLTWPLSAGPFCGPLKNGFGDFADNFGNLAKLPCPSSPRLFGFPWLIFNKDFLSVHTPSPFCAMRWARFR